MYKEYYAHSIESAPLSEWQLLSEHLDNVAEKASEFAENFHAFNWAKMAGQFHDIGKGSKVWQAYIRHANGVEDEFSKHYKGHAEHSIQGAQWLMTHSKEAGKLLAYCIAGHHGGLPNWVEDAVSGLMSRLNNSSPDVQIPIEKPEFENELPFKVDDSTRFGFQLQFFVRMIYSCLVDADFLDTEQFLSTEKYNYRKQYPALSQITESFWHSFNQLRDKALPSFVNTQREIVLNDCLAHAGKRAGLFSLTVPTGGGKTLSSMAFALEHAKIFNKKRIIYVIPFTSIIEQNAEVFRKVMGKDTVLEHHCNFIPEDTDWKTKLATENWDAPVVITTNVQFFDSFFARKSSKCRKLHNVANSVVIFDEIQAIPVEKLKACIEVLKELTINYNVTALLCTATQPAINFSNEFKSGLKNIDEIIQDIPSLFNALKRTDIEHLGTMNENDLAFEISKHKQALCIVNTRAQALNIFNLLSEGDGNFHLSALMHPCHRSKTLKEIRELLKSNLTCRVVSTQIIEAGVDIDFPVVFRMSTGMDSIAQAAGRCNREGHLDIGKVFIFKLADSPSPGFFRQTMQCAEPLLDKYKGRLLEPECIHEYFQNYYWLNQSRMDAGDIVKCCNLGSTGNIQFKDIAEFQIIKTATIPIIIALEDEAVSLVNQLDFLEYCGPILRKLQQYTVQVYPYQFDELRDWLECSKSGIYNLRTSELYSDRAGLICKPPEGEAFFG